MSLDLTLYFSPDTGGEEVNLDVFELNITHNLMKMADKSGLYDAMWRPEDFGYTKAGDIVDILQAGVDYMEANREELEKLNPKNGWGDYDGLLRSAKEYLDACARYPKATIYAWK